MHTLYNRGYMPRWSRLSSIFFNLHDDVIKWKHFPRNWPFVRGIHRSPVNSPHKGQWRGALMFSLICVWIKDWVNNREAGDLRRHRGHYDVNVMTMWRLLVTTHRDSDNPERCVYYGVTMDTICIVTKRVDWHLFRDAFAVTNQT